MCKAKDFNITDKQFAFCLEYVKVYNQTQAYQNIYKCSYDTARSNSSKLLANANIKACIDKLFSEITFNKQAIINECIRIKLEIASGVRTQKRIDKETGKVIEFSATPKDMNDATNDLLKLFGAYGDTTNKDADIEMEELKETKEQQPIEVEGLEDGEK